MRERPILFSGPMVRALLNGTKTQTRRVAMHTVCGVRVARLAYDPAPDVRACPYGVPGDRLWVRETFAPFSTGGAVYRADKPRFSPDAHEVVGGSWHPSIHMPRWASRLMLRITDVRVERLQDISEADAKAEGVEPIQCEPASLAFGTWKARFRYRDAYRALWDSINGKRAEWSSNPWVWVVAFERLVCLSDCPPGHCACHDGDARTVKREVAPCA